MRSRDPLATPVYRRRSLVRHGPNYDTDDGPETRLTPATRSTLREYGLSLFNALQGAHAAEKSIAEYCASLPPRAEPAP